MIELSKRLLRSCFRISTQLNLGIGAAVAFTIVASLVGWISFERVGDIQRRVNEGSVPEIVAAFTVARQSGALVAAAPAPDHRGHAGRPGAHRRHDRRGPHGLRGATDGAGGVGAGRGALAADPPARRGADRQYRGDRGLDVGALRVGRTAAGAAPGVGVASRRADRPSGPVDRRLPIRFTPTPTRARMGANRI